MISIYIIERFFKSSSCVFRQFPENLRKSKTISPRYMYGRGSGSEPPSTAERAEASEPPSPTTAPGAGLYEGSMSEAAEQAPPKPEQFSMPVLKKIV